ncbi:uncharacterized protein LOC118755409, partial [Rhagoletis pomonella]|uniref:uncharacterized protein LOC118755409 n=1 Tax=Rhagoletis pomonella TaxID=28610 RepID=UPI001781639B
MPDSPQAANAPKQPQPPTGRSQTENLPRQSDSARYLKEMQREFQRQIAALQNLIVSQNEQNKSSVNALRNEVQAIARTVATNGNNESSTNLMPPNDTNAQRQASPAQPNGANAQAHPDATPGESFSNLSSNPHSCPPAKAKKIYPLPKFGGQPEEWQAFIEDFRSTTVELEYSDIHNIMRIREALHGRARDTVESLLTSSKNVSAIIEVLSETYGRPELLMKSQIEKVRLISNVPEGKLEPLINFAIKVNNMSTFLKSVQGDHHLANPSLLSELVTKLPTSKQMQWAEKCLSLERCPNVEDFSKWLNALRKLANMVTDSLPSATAAGSRRTQDVAPHPHPPKANKYSFLSVAQSKCSFCQGECAALNACPQFISMGVDDRWKKVKELRICFSCLKPNHPMSKCYVKRRCGINNFARLHNRLLHPNETRHNGQSNLQQSAETTVASLIDRRNCHADTKNDGVLFQIIPVKLYHDNKEVSIYAMVDDGADATMLDWNIAHELGLKGCKDSLQLQWLNGVSSHESTEIVQLTISGTEAESQRYLMSKVFLSKKLALPIQSSLKETTLQKYSHLNGVPTYKYKNVHPKMIISLSHAYLTTPLDIPRTSCNPGPIAVRTRLGWIIYGPVGETASTTKRIFQTKIITSSVHEQEVEQIMRNYFEVETCGVKLEVKPVASKSEEHAMNILNSTTKYLNGRYECGLLWKSDFVSFPDTYDAAVQRLAIVERKFKSNADYAKQYRARIDDYISKGYARLLNRSEQQNHTPKTFFLPHFGVTNPNKDTLRVVFDAAAKVNGVSLNSALMAGPDFNQSLLAILFKFRQCPVAICGDIKEMFLQIITRKEDQDSLRFLWRNGVPTQPIQQYVMTRMIFGASCSPTIAQHIKNTNAEQFRQTHSRAVQAITERHYVDDYVDCFQSEAEAIQVVNDVIKIHAKAGFEIKKIISNSELINRRFGNFQNTAVDISVDKLERILGMQWMSITDNFVFDLKFHRVAKEIIDLKRKPTKREVLSTIMSVFDPYGLLANFTIGAKILMQSLWRFKLDWSDVIPDDLNGKWAAWIGQLKKVKDFSIPRCYFKDFINLRVELHIFCDASEVAMAMVAYWRLVTDEGVRLAFVAGKANCAPIKYQTIPKLELQGAVFAVRLRNCIIQHHDVRPSQVRMWTDSHTVIRWVKSDARRY